MNARTQETLSAGQATAKAGAKAPSVPRTVNQ
jgi:hypothetical protein